MKHIDKKTVLLLFICGMIPAAWIGLLAAPYADQSMFDMFAHTDKVFADPLHIQIMENSGRSVLLFLTIYIME